MVSNHTLNWISWKVWCLYSVKPLFTFKSHKIWCSRYTWTKSLSFDSHLCSNKYFDHGTQLVISTLMPKQNGRNFADDTFKCIFLNENVRISIRFSLTLIPKGSINNYPALVQIMAWRRPGAKPISEAVMVRLPMHICVTRPQWVLSWSVVHWDPNALWPYLNTHRPDATQLAHTTIYILYF